MIEKYFCGFFHNPLRPGIDVKRDQQSLAPVQKEDVLYWNPNGTFALLNSKFSGHEYVNLQLTRVHADLLKVEIDDFWATGCLSYLPQARVSIAYGMPYEEVHPRESPLDNAAIRLPLAEDLPQFLHHVQYLHQRRREYEQTKWRPPSRAMNEERGDDVEMDEVGISDSETRAIGRYTVDEYLELFDAEYKSQRAYIFKYESGDAKAVKYIPDTLTEMFRHWFEH